MITPFPIAQPSPAHAVVIGGSIAGLLATRVLADHFERVTIVERDALPDGPTPRPGVPHARHSHGFGSFLRTISEQLLPGIDHELISHGAVPVDAERDFCWLAPPEIPRPTPPVRSWLSCSRALAEWHIRQHVRALPQVQFVEEADVIGLVPTADGTGVAGVQLRQRKSQIHNLKSAILSASLVVDASGRHSKAPRWLAALGFPAPAETALLNQPYTLSSCIGAMPANFADGWKWFSLHPEDLEEGWSVGVHQIEGRRWLVFITMSGDERPPTERTEFVACLQSLEHPALSPLLEEVQWLTPVVGGHHSTNRLRHYDQLACQPDNFIVLGDAVCVFHPGYGQGMNIAAQESLLLAECLQEQRARYPDGAFTGFASHFQQRIAPLIAEQWAIETAVAS